MMRIAKILERQMHAAPCGVGRSLVGDLQIFKFPLLLVFQEHGIFKFPVGLDQRLRTVAILSQTDGPPFFSRSLRPQLPVPDGAGLQ